MFKYIITGLLSFSAGVLVTQSFYGKLISGQSMAWFGAQSCYLGCVKYAMLTKNRDPHEECNKISNVLYKDLLKVFSVLEN